MYLLYHFGYLPIIKFEFCQLCSVLYEVIELFIFWHVWKCLGELRVNWCLFAVALANKVKIGLAF